MGNEKIDVNFMSLIVKFLSFVWFLLLWKFLIVEGLPELSTSQRVGQS